MRPGQWMVGVGVVLSLACGGGAAEPVGAVAGPGPESSFERDPTAAPGPESPFERDPTVDPAPKSPSERSTSARPPGVVQPGGVPSHCTAGETAVLSCAIEGSSKVLSLCASPGATARQGYLQYRFGKSGTVELEYPSDRDTPPGRAFQHKVVLDPPGGSSAYTFTNAGTRYEIWSASHPGGEMAGVKVTPKGGKDVELTCGATAYGAGPTGMPNQEVLEIKKQAKRVLSTSPGCAGDQLEEWRRTAQEALALSDTDPVMPSSDGTNLLEKLRSMRCDI